MTLRGKEDVMKNQTWNLMAYNHIPVSIEKIIVETNLRMFTIGM